MLNIFLRIFRNRETEGRLGSESRFAFMLLHFNEGSEPKQGGLFMRRFRWHLKQWQEVYHSVSRKLEKK